MACLGRILKFARGIVEPCDAVSNHVIIGPIRWVLLFMTSILTEFGRYLTLNLPL